jgi:hypothetical protein
MSPCAWRARHPHRHSTRALGDAAAFAVSAYAMLQWLGRTYGATRAELGRWLPGDDLCLAPQVMTTHSITIDASPDAAWLWLAQMGWARGQWYTARWVDRLLFPANGPSADRIIPELQHLSVGDRILDGPPEAHCAFVVADLATNKHLVLHSTEHLPPGWAERFDASIDFTWAFVLDDLGDGRTRFLFRSRVRLEPRWVRAFYIMILIPADFVMARSGSVRRWWSSRGRGRGRRRVCSWSVPPLPAPSRSGDGRSALRA